MEKDDKGITLVALVITVILLMIITTVGIQALTGEGIIEYANNAATMYEEAQNEENEMLKDLFLLVNEERGS